MLLEGQSILPKALKNEIINYLTLGFVPQPNLRYRKRINKIKIKSRYYENTFSGNSEF